MNEAHIDYPDCVSLEKYPSHIICSSGKVFRRNGKEITGEAVEYKDTEGKTRTAKVHQMIAEVFVPNPKGKKHVGHIDGNKKNNHPSNLRWGHTGSPASQKLTEEDVKTIYTLFAKGESNRDIAKRFGVKAHTISAARNGANWERLYKEFYSDGSRPPSGRGTREGFLTDDQAKEIYALLSARKKNKDIAKDFNVNPSAISSIRTGKTHKHLYHLYEGRKEVTND